MKGPVASVIPLLRLRRDLNSFHYLIPASLTTRLHRGSLVWIPFRNRIVAGVVERVTQHPTDSQRPLKEIKRLASDAPLAEIFFTFAKWLEKNFAISAALALKTMLPPPHHSPKVRTISIPPKASSEFAVKRSRIPMIRQTQIEVHQMVKDKKSPLLLIPDCSEKWAILSGLMKREFEQHRQILIIVPDEFLLQEWLRFFWSSFSRTTMVFTSSHQSRSDQWIAFDAFRRGQCDALIGTKSSIFIVAPRLSLIILDEEESESHKQYDQNPRYDVRSILPIYEHAGFPTLQISRAPRTETFEKAFRSRTLVSVPSPHTPPRIQTIDREEEGRKNAFGLLPDAMIDAIRSVTQAGCSAFLYFNRKGFAKLLICRDCQTHQRCRTCGFPIELQSSNIFQCPSCKKTDKFDRCSHCRSLRLKPTRLGLSALASEAKKQFPSLTVQLLDAQHPELKTAQVICGTQYAFPRLPWPKIGYVGWITPEVTFSASAFETSDRFFQTLKFFQSKLMNTFSAQIQVLTHLPHHPAIQRANVIDPKPYYLQELKERRMYGYPPARRLAKLIFFNEDARINQSLAAQTRKRLQELHHSHIVEVSHPFLELSKASRTRNRVYLLLKLKPDSEIDLKPFLPETTLVDLDPITI